MFVSSPEKNRNIIHPKSDVLGLTREGYFLANPQALRDEVLKFLQGREALAFADSNFPLMAHFMLQEVLEAMQEEDKPNEQINHGDWHKELVDVIFFIESFAHSHHLSLDNYRIMSLTNSGEYQSVAKSSRWYDYTSTAIGDFPYDYRNSFDNLTTKLENVLALLYAKFSCLPLLVDPAEVMAKVMVKNERNYPKEYFGERDQFGRKLNPDELVAKYIHSSKCLRMIRKATGNCTDGLLPEFHRPFAHLILNWQNSESAQRELATLLVSPEWKYLLSGHKHLTDSGLSVVKTKIL